VKRLRRPSRKDSAFVKNADHARLWNLVEGAVVDAFTSHPNFLTDKGRQTVVRSVTKRVVGQIVGYAKQTLRGGRLGDCSRSGSNKAPDSSNPVVKAGDEGGDPATVRPHLGDLSSGLVV
jgi:hypothetical protein